MSYLISAIAGMAVLALLAWAFRATGPRRQDIWVCRRCGASFSDPDAAYLHIEAAHPAPPS